MTTMKTKQISKNFDDNNNPEHIAAIISLIKIIEILICINT